MSRGTPVYVTVWDLSAPSVVSWAFGVVGLGVYHTNVWLPELGAEWAFGGHGWADTTGVFTLPRQPATLPLPDDIPPPGECPIPNARYVGAYLVGHVAAESHTRSVLRARQTVLDLRTDPAWNGTAYNLLTRNCNHFADEACRRLTGNPIPAWINRTAGWANAVVWAVPRSLLDLDTSITPEPTPQDNPSTKDMLEEEQWSASFASTYRT